MSQNPKNLMGFYYQFYDAAFEPLSRYSLFLEARDLTHALQILAHLTPPGAVDLRIWGAPLYAGDPSERIDVPIDNSAAKVYNFPNDRIVRRL